MNIKKMKRIKEIKYLVLHCSATKLSRRTEAEDIDRWHRNQGYEMIGYHWYINRNGLISQGRKEQYAGAHVMGHNENSIGICYEGGIDEQGNAADTRTSAQRQALLYLLKELKQRYPVAEICGHRDFPNVHKACPCFDAKSEYKGME